MNDMRDCIHNITTIGHRVDRQDQLIEEFRIYCKQIKDSIPPSADNMAKELKTI
jgi:hypothetical protein